MSSDKQLGLLHARAFEMNEHDEAVADCKYASLLGEVALNQHLERWSDMGVDPDKVYREEGEYEYHLAIVEIKEKLGTEQCLLK
jgi:hypothetical protein